MCVNLYLLYLIFSEDIDDLSFPLYFLLFLYYKLRLLSLAVETYYLSFFSLFFGTLFNS